MYHIVRQSNEYKSLQGIPFKTGNTNALNFFRKPHTNFLLSYVSQLGSQINTKGYKAYPFYKVMGCPIRFVCITHSKCINQSTHTCKCMLFYLASSIVPHLQDPKDVPQVMISTHTLHDIMQPIHICESIVYQLAILAVPFLQGCLVYPFYMLMEGTTLSTIASNLPIYERVWYFIL